MENAKMLVIGIEISGTCGEYLEKVQCMGSLPCLSNSGLWEREFPVSKALVTIGREQILVRPRNISFCQPSLDREDESWVWTRQFSWWVYPNQTAKKIDFTSLPPHK